MVRDFRYIIKRVIIGILIGLFFIMFKSCDVHAWSFYSTGTINVYSQTQNCDLDENNNFNCTNGVSFKFTSQYKSNANNETQPMPWLIPNEHSILINNVIYEYIPDSPITTSSNARSIGLGMGSTTLIDTSGSGSIMNFSMKMFPHNTIDDNDNITYDKTIPINYNFKPYYCTYFNGTTWTYCNLILEIGSSSNVFWYVLDLPTNTTVEKVRLYFGSPNRQTTFASTTYGSDNIRIPDYQYISIDNSKTGFSKFYVNYNTWRQTNAGTPFGLWFYPKGYLLYQPEFYMPNGQFTLMVDSKSYVNNTYKFSYSSLDSSLQQTYTEQPERIEEEIENQTPSDDFESDLSESMSGFADNENSQRYLTTFEALLSYPIQKMKEQSSFDLVNHNSWIGANQIDSKLCWGTDGVVGDVSQPYKVQFFRDYKFTLPCPHSDIYTHLGYGDYGFYPSNFMGANNTGYTYNFISIWLVIQHGLLVYLLFVNVLNIYKYILDSRKSEIEVLEL